MHAPKRGGPQVAASLAGLAPAHARVPGSRDRPARWQTPLRAPGRRSRLDAGRDPHCDGLPEMRWSRWHGWRAGEPRWRARVIDTSRRGSRRSLRRTSSGSAKPALPRAARIPFPAALRDDGGGARRRWRGRGGRRSAIADCSGHNPRRAAQSVPGSDPGGAYPPSDGDPLAGHDRRSAASTTLSVPSASPASRGRPPGRRPRPPPGNARPMRARVGHAGRVDAVRAAPCTRPGPAGRAERHVGGHHVERVDGRLLSIGPAEGNHPSPPPAKRMGRDGIVEVRRPGGCRGQEPAGRRRLHLRDRAGDGPLQVDVVACELEEDAAARPRVLERCPRAAALGRAQAPAHGRPGDASASSARTRSSTSRLRHW